MDAIIWLGAFTLAALTLVLAMLWILWRSIVNLYEKIDAMLKAIADQKAKQDADTLALQQQVAGMAFAVNRLVDGLGAVFGVTFADATKTVAAKTAKK